MKFSKEKPPIYQRCHEKFGVKWEDGIIFAYGDTVYCKNDIGPDLEVHEGTHLKQQENIGKDVWWDRYMEEDTFRLGQELEAYENQIKFLKENVKDRNLVSKIIHKICLDLSSKMYGNIISYSEARKKLA